MRNHMHNLLHMEEGDLAPDFPADLQHSTPTRDAFYLKWTERVDRGWNSLAFRIVLRDIRDTKGWTRILPEHQDALLQAFKSHFRYLKGLRKRADGDQQAQQARKLSNSANTRRSNVRSHFLSQSQFADKVFSIGLSSTR